jgi:restriction system protein
MENIRTIIESIIIVLQGEKEGLSYKQVYKKIVDTDLYKFGAKDPKSVVHGKLRRHCRGIDFPTASPIKYFKVSKRINKLNYYVLIDETVDDCTECKEIEDTEEEMLPEEKIKSSYEKYVEDLKHILIDKVRECHPSFFERMVVDLLIKMGYGHDDKSGQVIGKSHDGGIDGIISEDKLGLSLIFVQAKRYAAGNNIGSHEIQAFVGAMKNVQKGVFITTSTYTKEAKSFANEQQQKSLKLIDGTSLAELMIRYGIGLESVEQYRIYKINEDYFADEG